MELRELIRVWRRDGKPWPEIIIRMFHHNFPKYTKSTNKEIYRFLENRMKEEYVQLRKIWQVTEDYQPYLKDFLKDKDGFFRAIIEFFKKNKVTAVGMYGQDGIQIDNYDLLYGVLKFFSEENNYELTVPILSEFASRDMLISSGHINQLFVIYDTTYNESLKVKIAQAVRGVKSFILIPEVYSGMISLFRDYSMQKREENAWKKTFEKLRERSAPSQRLVELIEEDSSY